MPVQASVPITEGEVLVHPLKRPVLFIQSGALRAGFKQNLRHAAQQLVHLLVAQGNGRDDPRDADLPGIPFRKPVHQLGKLHALAERGKKNVASAHGIKQPAALGGILEAHHIERLISGIGKEKAYGMGMLTIIPVRA